MHFSKFLVPSCSDDGTVHIQCMCAEEDKGTIIQFNERLTTICIEDIFRDTSKRERSFVIGA